MQTKRIKRITVSKIKMSKISEFLLAVNERLKIILEILENIGFKENKTGKIKDIISKLNKELKKVRPVLTPNVKEICKTAITLTSDSNDIRYEKITQIKDTLKGLIAQIEDLSKIM